MVILKTKSQIDIMDEANNIVRSILSKAKASVEIDMTSFDLDKNIESYLSDFKGAKSAFKNYLNYPNVSCISINSTVVHGIPNKTKFKNGDIISIDFGVYFNGFAGDAAITFILGEPNNKKDLLLVKETEKALYAGIDQMVIGNRLHDIAKAIDDIAKVNEFGNVRNFCGHGIGAKMHEPPSVFNYIEPREPNIRLQEGLVLALEPMFSLGSGKCKVLEDGWTAQTVDNQNAAHWELSVAITEDGPRILGNEAEN